MKVRVTMTFDEETVDAIAPDIPKKERHSAVQDFMVIAIENALPIKMKERKVRKINALKEELEQLELDLD